jgi:hypothetical protein
MPAPYRAEEVASALVEAVRRSGRTLHRLEVAPDERARVWIVRVTDRGGADHRLTFPFASARGIYTPAEIAAHLVSGSWPFG